MVVCIWDVLHFFFFKQKTAYEMRISDWSSDVCSSDLSRSRRWRLRCAAKPPFGRWLTNVVRGPRGRAVGGNEAQLQATPRQRSEHQIRRSEENTSELQSLMRNSYAHLCLKTKNHQVAHKQNNQKDKHT